MVTLAAKAIDRADYARCWAAATQSSEGSIAAITVRPPPGRRRKMRNGALNYMRLNFPNRFDLFSRLPEKGPYRNNVVLPRLVQRDHQLMRMQDQNPEVYDVVLQQAKLEDDVLGWAKAKSEGKPDAEVRLHESVRRMVQHGLDERRMSASISWKRWPCRSKSSTKIRRTKRMSSATKFPKRKTNSSTSPRPRSR